MGVFQTSLLGLIDESGRSGGGIKMRCPISSGTFRWGNSASSVTDQEFFFKSKNIVLKYVFKLKNGEYL